MNTRTIKSFLWVVVALIIAITFFIQSLKDNRVDQLKRDTVAACIRDNYVRAEENTRAQELDLLRDILVSFTNEASLARAAAGNLSVAHKYAQYADQASKLKFSHAKIIDCNTVFHR